MSLEEQTTKFFEIFRKITSNCETALDWDGERPINIEIGAYGELYELPLKQVAGYLFKRAGLLDAAKLAAQQPDPQLAIMEMAESEEPVFDITRENASATIVAMVVLFNHLDSIMRYSMPVTGLLERVSVGDDDRLFDAVVLDAAVMSSKPIANRIAAAAINDDRAFFDRLAKAITQTKPVRPQARLDETRLLMQLFEDAGVLAEMTDSALTEWAVNRVGVYPDSKDPHSAIRDQRRKRDNAKGGPKR